MGIGTILAIVLAIAVVALVVFFLLREKGGALPPETEARPAPPKAKPELAKPEPKPEAAKPEPPEPARAEKAEKKSKAVKAPRDEEPAEPGAAGELAPEPSGTAEPPPTKAARAETHEPKSKEPRKVTQEDVAALKKGLASTRGGFIARLAKLFGGKKEIDPGLLDQIQEVLLSADIGVATTEKILGRLKERLDRNELGDEDRVWDALREEARAILGASGGALQVAASPSLILVVGVNGVGKTTTIGKLASRLQDEGKKVILAAGDTFRAAAVLQLEVWGRRVQCEVVKGKERADPGSVIFEAIKKAKETGADVVIADTAGRLHTKSNLMEELKKVARTAEKALEHPVDETILVLDSTTGQNAIQQAQLFKEAIPLSGIVLTKLDGTAKGGVILGIVDAHGLPVRFIGIGERVEDLREFDPGSFVDALFTKPEDETAAA